MVRDECPNAKDRKGGDFSNLLLESAVAREEKSLVNARYDGSKRFVIPTASQMLSFRPLALVIPTTSLCHSDRRKESACGRHRGAASNQQIPQRLKPFRNDKKFLIGS